MTKLISDFFCVATSGATIDGREIKPEWLTGSARSYNADFYAARIWFEHMRYFGAMGDVFAVKAEKGDDGLIRLYNRIIPSARLISMKKNGQALYSSIEVAPQLKATGKPYQVGLAVTDSPASFGTDRLEFAMKHLESDSLFSASMEITDWDFSKERTIFDMARSLFGKHRDDEDDDETAVEWPAGSALPEKKFSVPDTKPKSIPAEDFAMTNEELTQLFNDVLDKKLGELKAEQQEAFAKQLSEAVTPLKEQLTAQQENLTELKSKQDEVIELATPPVGSNPHQKHHAGGDPETKQFSC